MRIDAGSCAAISLPNADKWKEGGGSGQRREAEVDGDWLSEMGEGTFTCLSTHLFVVGKQLKRLFGLKA